MLNAKKVLFRHIGDIEPVGTSHGVGEKRVVAIREDVGYPITQMARTRLKAGDWVESHIHPTMDEHFFFLEGKCEITIDEVNTCICQAEDYLFIPANHAHALRLLADTLMITMGVETCSKSISD